MYFVDDIDLLAIEPKSRESLIKKLRSLPASLDDIKVLQVGNSLSNEMGRKLEKFLKGNLGPVW